jgi:hypothetical protein
MIVPGRKWESAYATPIVNHKEQRTMFLTIGIIILVLWAVGAFVVPVVGALIHILLVVALISIIWHFVAGKKTV